MTDSELFARAFLKWAGGKAKSFDTISIHLPDKFRFYFEPFVGGGAMFFGLAAQKRFEHAVLGDMNQALIHAYTTIRDAPQDLIDMLGSFPITKEYFDGLRTLHPDTLDALECAAWIIFLNKTCFNGLFRVNKAGFFNVPWGKYANPKTCDVENINACNQVLKDLATIVRGDFEVTTEQAKTGDVVYFDPPYIPLSKTSNFTGYQADGFGQKEQERLAKYFRTLVQDRGVHAVLSNSDTEMTRDLYAGFEQHVVPVKRAINSKGTGRGAVNELIVVGKRS